MKKQKQSTLDEALSDRVKPTGAIQKKKKKAEFEVRVPRIIVRNLGFNVCVSLVSTNASSRPVLRSKKIN